MKLTKSLFIIVAFTLMLIAAGCGKTEQPNTLEKNYGYSHGEVNIGPNGAEALSIDEIVPPKSELCANLQEAGFTIAEFETALDSGVAAERVYAEKDGLFMDICYGLSVEQAPEIFASYEAEYKEYYLIAQNKQYVYAVSDKKTFETAGFETLETNGILFVWE